MLKYSLKYYIQNRCVCQNTLSKPELESYIDKTIFSNSSSSVYVSSSFENDKLIFKIVESPNNERGQIHIQKTIN